LHGLATWKHSTVELRSKENLSIAMALGRYAASFLVGAHPCGDAAATHTPGKGACGVAARIKSCGALFAKAESKMAAGPSPAPFDWLHMKSPSEGFGINRSRQFGLSYLTAGETDG
jgi:hypothetical protein